MTKQLQITKKITNRQDQIFLKKYYSEINKIKRISVDEEVELAQRIKMGDLASLNKLVEANLRFVVSVAKQYQNNGLSLQDLIGEGNLGLIKAAEKFDETKGFKFISYAIGWIRFFIIRALTDQSYIIQIPMNKLALIRKMEDESLMFEQKNERSPSMSEMADILKMPESKIPEIIVASKKHISYDRSIKEDDDNFTLLNLLPSDSPKIDDWVAKESLSKNMEDFLSILDEDQRIVLKMRSGIARGYTMTISEIAENLEIEEIRVSKLNKNAIAKLRSKVKRFKKIFNY